MSDRRDDDYLYSGNWERAARTPSIDGETLQHINELTRLGDLLHMSLAKRSQEEAKRVNPDSITPFGESPQYRVSLEAGRTYRLSHATSTNEAEILPQEKVTPVKMNGMKVTFSEQPTAEKLQEKIYEVRDEWCAENGEWDGSKIPVAELAERLSKKLMKP